MREGGWEGGREGRRVSGELSYTQTVLSL